MRWIPWSTFSTLRKPPSARCPTQGLAKLQESTALEEDDRSHRFDGCPVLMNDKIVAVVRKDRPRGRRLRAAVLRPEVVRQRCSRSAKAARSRGRRSLATRQNSRSAVAIEVEFRLTGATSKRITYELDAGRGVRQDNGRRGRATVAGEGPLPLRRSARLLRRRHPGRCRGDSRGPGGASQRELPAAHAARRRHDRDDGLGVARQRRRRHALRPSDADLSAADCGLGRLLWKEAAHLGRGAGGPGDLARARRCPGRRRTRRSAWSGRCPFPPCGASIGAPPTR